jgi:3-phenylpropionate/cinnamic acid dioxygenase small subunit
MELSPQDEREIGAVLVRYASGIDRRDWAQLASCFTADCAGDYGSFGSWTGAQAITQFMREAHAAVGATLHRLSNITIGGEQSRVVSRSYVDALLMPGEAGGVAHQGIGYYDDEWRRTEAGWQIAQRRFTLVSFT